MKPYPKYKPSGIEWIGDIPEHWGAAKFTYYITLKHGFQFRDYDFTESGLKVVKITQLLADGTLDLSKCSYIDPKRLNEFSDILIKKGDILMALTGGTIGKIIRTKEISEPVLQNYRVGNFIPINSSFDKSYLFWVLSSRIILEQIFYAQRETGQPNIGKEDFSRMVIPKPSLIEQKDIAHFLDTKSSEIDHLTFQKQRLISLLQEEKIAVINEAVTKGLNHDVKMKDSGIPWLGEIPKHWDVVKIKYLTQKITDGEHISPSFQSEGIPFLSAKDIRERTLNFDVDKYVSYKDAEKFRKRCNPERGDILIVSRGATIGRVGFVETDRIFCLLGSVILLKPKEVLSPLFLFHALNTSWVKESFSLTSESSAQQAIYLVDVANIEIPYPPTKEEQSEITNFIELESKRIDNVVEKIQKEITLLMEYRTALISEAIAGKIDIRDINISE